MKNFNPREYADACGWDFSCIEATAERGLADADVEAIDQWAGVHGDHDSPTDEAEAARVSRDAQDSLLSWCREKVAAE